MSKEEINALPVHKHKAPGPESAGSSVRQASSSSAPVEPKQDSRKASMRASKDEPTCTICLDRVKRGKLVRSLPCLHQE
ncbi:E3 ubiquitin-protein ligase SDIR1-like isoform X2 [Durio zibethinus]|uniref:RING-type E3 ubiquitin transferase n=1 Tax=Durio zibethinus TaxID=66656 RepID=A0A6P5ZVT7_DURZI|nr:E3 ubiquitin-protein ligase SDIR1-like isoform X2 [Durio zibethinus]